MVNGQKEGKARGSTKKSQLGRHNVVLSIFTQIRQNNKSGMRGGVAIEPCSVRIESVQQTHR